MLDYMIITERYSSYAKHDDFCINGRTLGDASEAYIDNNGLLLSEHVLFQKGASEKLTDLLISVANIAALCIMKAQYKQE